MPDNEKSLILIEGGNSMNIVVCVKQVLDPEIPAEKFIIKDNKVQPPQDVELVLNPYDAQAVELALRIKEMNGGRITAITVGSGESMKAVRRAVAMGADEGIVISDDHLKDTESPVAAYILAHAIQKLIPIDLVLCGCESADWSNGIVGPIIAEKLGYPIITLVKEVELSADGTLKVNRVIPDGNQLFEVILPAVLTVSNDVGLPRLPTGMGIVSSIRKEIPVWTGKDINVDLSSIQQNTKQTRLVSLSIPNRERQCEFIKGDNPEGIASNLAEKLRSLGAI
jgi:electron transfer flavoprotein beta subunit